jgi:hypothetical protein
VQVTLAGFSIRDVFVGQEAAGNDPQFFLQHVVESQSGVSPVL